MLSSKYDPLAVSCSALCLRIFFVLVPSRIFSVLMGDNVAPRKEFINQHANNLKLDDLDF